MGLELGKALFLLPYGWGAWGMGAIASLSRKSIFNFGYEG